MDPDTKRSAGCGLLVWSVLLLSVVLASAAVVFR